MKNGVCLFVEFKRPKSKPRATQLLEHDRLRNAGMVVYVIDNIDSGLELLEVFENEFKEKE